MKRYELYVYYESLIIPDVLPDSFEIDDLEKITICKRVIKCSTYVVKDCIPYRHADVYAAHLDHPKCKLEPLSTFTIDEINTSCLQRFLRKYDKFKLVEYN